MKLSFYFIAVIFSGLLVKCADYNMNLPDPVTVSITGVTDTTVTLKWTRSRDIDFSGYHVYYSKNDNVEPNDPLSRCVDTLLLAQDTIKVVGNLSRDSLYFFRIIVNTTRGLISSSNTVDTTTTHTDSSDTTHGSSLKPSSVQLAIVFASDSTVSLKWTQSTASDFLRYYIYYSKNSAVGKGRPGTYCFDSLNNKQDTSIIVDNLLPNTSYYFRVNVVTNSSRSSESNIADTTTDSLIFVPVPPEKSTLFFVQVSDTTVTLKWTKSTASDFKKYYVCYSQNLSVELGKPGSICADSLSIKNDTITRINNLLPNAQYHFRVFVSTISNLQSASDPIDTITSVRRAVNSLTAVELDSNLIVDSSVVLSWSKNGDAAFKWYRIYYSLSQRVDTLSDILDSLPRNSIRLTLSGQFLTHRYWFMAAVEDSNGNKKASNIVANFPVQLFCDSATTSSIALHWTQSTSSNFSSYKLYRDTLPSVSIETGSRVLGNFASKSTVSCTDSLLTSNKRYWYRLYEWRNTETKYSGSNSVNQTTK